MYVRVVSRFYSFNTSLFLNDTIDSIMEFIHNTLYIPPQYQKLYLNGTLITSLNHNDLEEWNIMEVVDVRDEPIDE
uniref:Ubiquitin-like domain-containing protein n=1 Tax=Panagrellus redivivus TaxID=6233 RepID=A0A7E4V4G9_PANRE